MKRLSANGVPSTVTVYSWILWKYFSWYLHLLRHGQRCAANLSYTTANPWRQTGAKYQRLALMGCSNGKALKEILNIGADRCNFNSHCWFDLCRWITCVAFVDVNGRTIHAVETLPTNSATKPGIVGSSSYFLCLLLTLTKLIIILLFMSLQYLLIVRWVATWARTFFAVIQCPQSWNRSHSKINKIFWRQSPTSENGVWQK